MSVETRTRLLIPFAVPLIVILFHSGIARCQPLPSSQESPILYLTPKWSPNGHQIAFCSNRDKKLAIYTISSDGKNLLRITDTAYEAGVPGWSPDGRFLVYHKILENGLLKLFTKDLHAEIERQITTGNSIDYSPSWSSNNAITFNSRTDTTDLNHHINILSLTTNKVLTISDTRFDYSAPYISLDGKRIVCIRTTAMTKSFKETPADELKKIRTSSEIMLMNNSGTEIRNISKDTLINRSPCISKNGKNIYYLTITDSGSVIKKYNLNSKLVKDVFKPAGIVNSFNISPDENKIVYSSKRDSGFGIYVWDIKNKVETLVIGN